MRRNFALAVAVAAVTMAQVAPAWANREPEPFPAQEDPNSLAAPDYRGYRPAWADPYAEPSGLGINDDPTPFDPSDVEGGPSPLDPGEY